MPHGSQGALLRVQAVELLFHVVVVVELLFHVIACPGPQPQSRPWLQEWEVQGGRREVGGAGEETHKQAKLGQHRCL